MLTFPIFPDPISGDGVVQLQRAFPYEDSDTENLKSLVVIDGDTVTMPLFVWERYYMTDNEVVMPFWYWIRINVYVANIEEEKANYEAWKNANAH